MIEKLTPEQEQELLHYRRQAFLDASSPETREKECEEILRAFYKATSQKEPTITWYDSPHAVMRYLQSQGRNNPLGECFTGHCSPWWFYRQYCADLIDWQDPRRDMLNRWAYLSRWCGWWWPYEGEVHVARKPIVIRWEDSSREDTRLHCPDGPAVRYRDGEELYVWRGTVIPAEWIRDKCLTAQTALGWPQAEQRTAACEILGWDKILGELKARVIDTDVDPMIGTLLEVDLPDAPGEQFLNALCGTGRTVVIPVGTGFSTALDANAATYNIEPELLRDYEVRT